jgi:hypothetical protein
MRNGAWHDHEHQQVIIAQVAEEASQALRRGQGRPQNAPRTADQTPADFRSTRASWP